MSNSLDIKTILIQKVNEQKAYFSDRLFLFLDKKIESVILNKRVKKWNKTMFSKLFKIILLLLLMTLSKIIFLISVQVSENNFHLEIKGFLAFLVVDIFLLNIIHSKKLMYLELLSLIIMVCCEFSGNHLSVIISNILFVAVNLYILVKTWNWNPISKIKK